MRYVELIERSVSNRGLIIPLEDFKVIKRDYECYNSMFNFSDDIIEHVKVFEEQNKYKSVTGYSGECGMNFLWIDIDTDSESSAKENIARTIEETKRIVVNLDIKYGLTYDKVPIYFSGNKGFHIGISAKCFGADEFYSENLPKIAKAFVREISDNSKLVDYPIYNTTRIFRTPMSRHSKSGLYKVLVPFQYIENFDIESIIRKSEVADNSLSYQIDVTCRNSAITSVFRSVVERENKAPDLFTAPPEQGIDKPSDEISKENLKQTNVTYNTTLFRVPRKGERNNEIHRMAVRLFSTALKANEVIDIVRLVTDSTNYNSMKMGIEPLSEQEVRALINSAYKYTRAKRVEQSRAVSASSLATDVFSYASNLKYVPTPVKEFNFDLGGGLVLGNLYSFIGRGGTMKSILLESMSVMSSINDIPGIYINSEMSANVFFNRKVKQIIGIDFIELVKTGQMNMKQARDIETEIEKRLKGNLYVINENNLSPQDISDHIKRIEDNSGKKIFYVMVDSLNAMAMVGNYDEVKTAFQNSKELKEVAKSRNVAIGLINHTNNACPVSMRDNSQYVRGGSKIIDNGDGYFCLSKCVDRVNSNYNVMPPNLVYLPGYVYVRFVNKRESGNTIDKVLKLNEFFHLEPIEKNPAEFD